MLRRPRILLCALLIGLGLASALPLSTTVLAARHASVSSLLNPLVPKLAKARTPVYLPSWLPSFHFRLYRTAKVNTNGYRYAVYLSRDKTFSFKSLVFWMTGDRVGAEYSKKKVLLGHGVTGYLVQHPGDEGLTISWVRGGHAYMIGGLRYQSRLVRAAMSVVLVH